MATKRKSKKKNNKKQLALIISISMLTVVLVITALATITHHKNKPVLSADNNIAEGIDVSSHNGKIEWDVVSENTDFAIIRVGYRGYGNGEIFKDKKAKYNLNHATSNGIPVGAYFYSQATNDDEAIEEAKLAIKMCKGYDIALPIFIDFEYACNSNGEMDGRLYNANLTPKQATSLINAFCKEIKKAGYTPGVYASSSVFLSKMKMSSLDSDAVIWVADYNDKVSYINSYDIWQYTSKGKLDGVKSKYVDKNHWYLDR